MHTLHTFKKDAPSTAITGYPAKATGFASAAQGRTSDQSPEDCLQPLATPLLQVAGSYFSLSWLFDL